MAQRIADELGGDVHDLDHAVVVHAGGPDHAQRAHHLAVELVGRADHGQLLERHDLAFTADVDAHAFRLAGKIQQPEDLGLLLEQVEGAAQIAHVAGEIADRQQVALARDDNILLGAGHGFRADVDGRLHERGNLAAQQLHLALEALAHLFHRQARVVAVEEVGGFDQLRGRVVHVGEDDAVLHVTVGRYDDDQKAPLRQPHEFDVLEHRGAARHQHHPHELGKAGQQVGGVGDDFLRLLGHELGRHDIGTVCSEHGVHEQPVAPGGRNAARRGVRADDQPQVFEVSHHIAYRGRRQFKPRRTRQGSRAHRLAVSDITLDQRFEQQLGTFVEHVMILMM